MTRTHDICGDEDYDAEGTWTCTRQPGHVGFHDATDYSTDPAVVVAQWPTSDTPRYAGSRGELSDRLELLLTRWERDADDVWGGDQADPIRQFVAEFRQELTK